MNDRLTIATAALAAIVSRPPMVGVRPTTTAAATEAIDLADALLLIAEEEPEKPDVLTAYRRLHDGLSRMIEGGTLVEGDAPDDFAWLVESLAQLAGMDPEL